MAFFEITDESQGLFKDKGSKFYAFAFPVKSREEAEICLSGIKKKYHDARHYCYAFRIGELGELSFASDDGEPAHSAGDPILGQIRSRELTNTLVVVIRYFGGVLLGVRGLIEAYKNAAAEALDLAAKKEIIAFYSFRLIFPYEKTQEVNRIMHPFRAKVISAEYNENCKITYQVLMEQKEAVITAFDKLYGVTVIEDEGVF
ncbi:MAG: YigZ family protein [Bacteroidia bacterium]|nr:YigZ family protein [Bacteroidia bacterium]